MLSGLRSRFGADVVIGDSVLAVALAAASVWFVLALRPQGTGIDAVTVALVVLGCLPVALRRRRPYLMLCLAQIPLMLLVAVDQVTGVGGIAALVLLYSVAAYRGLTLSLLAVVTVAGYAVVATVGGIFTTWTEHVLAATLMFTAWVAGRSVRLRRAYLAELEERAERLERARESDRRAARAEERSRIARELHDVVAHHVSVMTVQAVAARRVLASSPDTAADALSAIEEMGRAAMVEMRNIVGVLRTDGDDSGERAPQPGMHDLPALVEQMREAGLRTQLWIEGDGPRLPPGLDLAAYRLIQEALTNSLRHAGMDARAWVTVRHEPGALSVRVEDDGRGPVPEPANGDRPGHGLVGIRERVALYGGMLQTGPRQGGGFEVRARFPLKTGY